MNASLWHAPLDQFQKAVAAPHPAPAAVATACVTASLGLSLLIKALRITGHREDLIPPAETIIADLRTAADADVAAVEAYVQTRDTSDLRGAPDRALAVGRRAADLCMEAGPFIKGLISADVASAGLIVEGSVKAIEACIAANQA